ncbi:MAG TPA: lipopolysaccharide transport periplasmic protein LptA, partial [Ramlibacter sp.]|nr:lipopolysaccharide transport periplasmic protein LptA [Ramlibacter sp.]
ADRVKFIRRAEMRRYRGATLNDEITGSLITYENTTDVFTVDGGPASGTPGGRVRATLAPRESGTSPVSRAPATPAAPLRPSTTLGGDRK